MPSGVAAPVAILLLAMLQTRGRDRSKPVSGSSNTCEWSVPVPVGEIVGSVLPVAVLFD